MLALRSVAGLRAARPSTLVAKRTFHVENKVNNNFPFKYEGDRKRAFTLGFVALLGLGSSVPFLASAFQIKKASA
ncbi:hypothetical protein Rhopal_004117-T1 [Rhodotorula paludigena]|uniref:Cytochrome c oxidase subunit 8, mitochondrial n=1 Tax=Rhodotorula paludigena TaxID=86838 RepID=A0AAV5GEY8_9BASI|nr:hypothetical protein Rhopal_004117-T1 [Rhodotorula paludigena]